MEPNKIYCEDCIDTMSRMEDNFIDLTVTSPPYDNLRTYNDNIDETWNESVWKPIIKELYRVTKEGGVVVWVVGDATINGSESGVSFNQALWAKEVGFRLHDTMIYFRLNQYPGNVRYRQDFEYMFVWSKGKPKSINIIKDKKNISAGKSARKTSKLKSNGERIDEKKRKGQTYSDYGERSNMWVVDNPGGNNTDKLAYNHPAVYPEELPKDHIKSWSNEGDLVYDPFMGSGTTAKMAHLLKRDWIGSELSQEYVDLAYKRLEKYLTQGMLF